MYDAVESLFNDIIQKSIERFQELGWMNEILQDSYIRLNDTPNWNHARFNAIQRFFRRVNSQDIKIAVILDEFDHARYLFRNDSSNFQKLRELCSNPDFGICIITTSRRTIREIELQSVSISTLDGVFQKIYLEMFNDMDIEDLAKLASTHLIQIRN
ncbi:hypothetical protein ES708_29620 [subsurface metagenome]